MWDQRVRASYHIKYMSVWVDKNRTITYESNTPNVIAYGAHLNDSGMSPFEQIVLPVSSSNLAAGNRAARVRVRNQVRARSGERTILERGDHREEGGIVCIPIVVYAHCVDVKAPHCFSGVDA